MTPRRAAVLAAGSLAVATAFVGAFGGFGASGRSGPAPASVPTETVRRGPFVRKVRADGVLKAVNATPLQVPGTDVSGKVGWIAEDGTAVRKGDVVVRLDPSETRKNLLAGQGERARAELQGDKEKAESGALVANLGRDADQAGLELETARTFQQKDPELFSRNEIVEADIDVELSGRREAHYRTSRTVRQGLSRLQLDLYGVERQKADLKIGKAERELAALEITAPHDGIFLAKRNWRGALPQVGQAVWSGQTLGEIPDLGTLEAEVWVLEADAGGLAVGEEAEVALEAHPGVTVKGTVKSVDALARPRLRGVPVQYFGAVLSLARTDPAVMKPGERVTATVVLGEEKDAVTVPRQALFEKDGKKVVYVRSASGFAPRGVTLGAAAIGRVAVTAGLAGGEVVALADPTGERAAAGATPGPASSPGARR